MSLKRPTVKIILTNSGETETKELPVKLRITYDRQPRLYKTGIYLTQEDFSKIMLSTRLRDNKLRHLRDELSKLEQLAQDICDSIEPFNFLEFKRKFCNEPLENTYEQKQSLEYYYISYINELIANGHISTASGYNCSLKSLRKFSKSIDFDVISVEFLKNYEKWMLSNKKSVTTISMYLRCLRVMINMAIEKGDLDRKTYPFGRRKYQIPAVRNVKKALSKKEILMIMNCDLPFNSSQDKARDFWILSYLCNGLNIKDILSIRNKDIIDDNIHVIRAKTKNSSNSAKKAIVIPISNNIKAIIHKWSIPYLTQDDYLFDILKTVDDEIIIRKKVQNFTRFINKNLAKVCVQIGIKRKVTTYFARHSFSTILKNSGVPIEYISEALGHTNFKTTMLYLDSFDKSKKIEYSKFLTE